MCSTTWSHRHTAAIHVYKLSDDGSDLMQAVLFVICYFYLFCLILTNSHLRSYRKKNICHMLFSIRSHYNNECFWNSRQGDCYLIPVYIKISFGKFSSYRHFTLMKRKSPKRVSVVIHAAVYRLVLISCKPMIVLFFRIVLISQTDHVNF